MVVWRILTHVARVHRKQSGRSLKVVAPFSATNFSSYIIELLQLHDAIQIKGRAHLSTFKIFIFEKCSCFNVLVVFLVIVQSSELVSVWFCEKMTFFPNFFSYHIFAIYVGGASLGLPTACRLIAVSGARLPSVDGLVVRCTKMHHHVKSAITIC